MLSDFGMRLPTDIVLLSRALVTLDGTLRVLCPGRSLMASAMELLESPDDRAGRRPRQLVARRAAGRRCRTCAGCPSGSTASSPSTGRGELRVRTVTDEDSRRIVRTLVNRALLGGDRRGRPRRVGRPARRRRIPDRRSPRAPGCSRSSATAGCSPAPCSCCASSPPSPGTARHEPSLAADTIAGRCRPCPTGRPASATTGTPATSSASSCGRSATVAAAAVHRRRHPDERRRPRRPRRGRGAVPDPSGSSSSPASRSAPCSSRSASSARSSSAGAGGASARCSSLPAPAWRSWRCSTCCSTSRRRSPEASAAMPG